MSFKIVGIGEVLWDMFPTGAEMGGAPANFAWQAQALGARGIAVTRVGNDDLGREILRRYQEHGMSADTMQVDDDAPTSKVTVALAGDGVPTFTIHENVAWDRLALTPAALQAVADADALCFGSLAQRCEPARTTIQTLVASAPPRALRVFDANLRQHYFSRELVEKSLQLANVLKVNDGELAILAGLLGLRGSIRGQIESLAQQYDLQSVALTRGPDGSLLFQAGRWSDRPGEPTEVVDTVGAGDAFAASFVMGLLRKMDLDQINALAGEVARHVCSRPGATPPLPENLVRWACAGSPIQQA
jgi:fructokinase